jgi:hypothetical protein
VVGGEGLSRGRRAHLVLVEEGLTGLLAPAGRRALLIEEDMTGLLTPGGLPRRGGFGWGVGASGALDPAGPQGDFTGRPWATAATRGGFGSGLGSLRSGRGQGDRAREDDPGSSSSHEFQDVC